MSCVWVEGQFKLVQYYLYQVFLRSHKFTEACIYEPSIPWSSALLLLGAIAWSGGRPTLSQVCVSVPGFVSTVPSQQTEESRNVISLKLFTKPTNRSWAAIDKELCGRSFTGSVSKPVLVAVND